METSFVGKSRALSTTGIAAAAATLRVGAPEIWTVIGVETSGCGFLPDRRPQILFERHIFHRLTDGRFDDGDISAPTPGGYGTPGAGQYDRLTRAILLDRSAALQSASWGLGQVMGENCIHGCFPDVDAMALAMADSEDSQMQAVTAFITGANLASALRNHNWSAFAAGYNGPSYAINQYDTKLAEQFQKYAAGLLPDLDLRAVQLYLTFAGYSPGPIDGMRGSRTQAAIQEFQTRHNLPATGKTDADLLDLIFNSI